MRPRAFVTVLTPLIKAMIPVCVQQTRWGPSFFLVHGQVEADGCNIHRHPGLDPGSRSGRRLDPGFRRDDETVHLFLHD